jgi:hypothetical protein
MDEQNLQTRILDLVDKIDLAWMEAIRLRDERQSMLNEFRRTGKKANQERFNVITRQLHEAVEQVSTLRTALTALGAPSLPLDADFMGKPAVRMDVAMRVLKTSKLPPAELAELNRRALAIAVERRKEERKLKDGAR